MASLLRNEYKRNKTFHDDGTDIIQQHNNNNYGGNTATNIEATERRPIRSSMDEGNSSSDDGANSIGRLFLYLIRCKAKKNEKLNNEYQTTRLKLGTVWVIISIWEDMFCNASTSTTQGKKRTWCLDSRMKIFTNK